MSHWVSESSPPAPPPAITARGHHPPSLSSPLFPLPLCIATLPPGLYPSVNHSKHIEHKNTFHIEEIIHSEASSVSQSIKRSLNGKTFASVPSAEDTKKSFLTVLDKVDQTRQAHPPAPSPAAASQHYKAELS
ncbi:hypothetical protein E2C01_078305 [Portunus trituberculatus]|uniref:Uncharacterized protein n=1 Tax=Portunus trituberculatus TaxID=210409 RepID=A0A5B7IMA4_PORTR|nr:hypothetical protein [Portunus trituberculatus]